MARSSIRKLILASLFVIVCLVMLTLVGQPVQPASGNGVLPLQVPSFISVARAEGAAPSAVSAIVDEAGISAYFQAPVSITISSVASLFRTVEFSNTDYIIGSIPVPNYDETYDVHVYVHHDGWVLAYYMISDNASKIFDWKSYDGVNINTTKLRNVLSLVAVTAGSPFPGPTYYDFRSPNATHLMLIAEAVYSGYTYDTFQVTLPGSFIYSERSWSLYGSDGTSGADYSIDGVQIKNQDGNHEYWGALTASQLLPDSIHIIQIHTGYYGNVFGGLVLTYRVP